MIFVFGRESGGLCFRIGWAQVVVFFLSLVVNLADCEAGSGEPEG